MTNELIKEIAERLGRSGPEVEKALQAFSAAVNDKLMADGEASLAGLGILRQDGTSRHFEPGLALRTAVNYRWESPENPTGAAEADPVKPLRKVSWSPDVGIDPTETPFAPVAPEAGGTRQVAARAPSDFAPKQATQASGASRPAGAASSSPPAPATGGASPSAPASPAGGSAPAPAASAAPPSAPASPAGGSAPAPAMGAAPTPAPVSVPKVPAPPPPVSFDPVDPLVEDLTFETLHPTFGSSAKTAAAFADDGPSGSHSPSPSSPPVKAPPSRRPRQGGLSRNAVLGILALVVLVVALGFWLNSRNQVNQPTVSEPAAGDTSAVAASGQTQGLGGDSTAASTPTGTPATQTRTPSNAGDLDLTSNGYTLIVGSSLQLSRAQADMARFSNMGLPVGILSYPDADGSTRHRIAVGEFPTAAAADNARRAREASLPEGTWVRRIKR